MTKSRRASTVEKVVAGLVLVVGSGTCKSEADFSTLGVEAVRVMVSGVKPCCWMR